jgi:hypothetical protein
MDNKIIEDVAKTLNMSVEDVKKYSKEVPEIDGYYFWQPVRGGISVIINKDRETLCATSSISFEKHLKYFMDGKRS